MNNKNYIISLLLLLIFFIFIETGCKNYFSNEKNIDSPLLNGIISILINNDKDHENNSSPVLDATFNNTGIVNYFGNGVEGDAGIRIISDHGGNILVSGWSTSLTNTETAIWRYKSSGLLDSSFGNNGVVLNSVDNNATTGADIAIDDLDNIYVISRYINGYKYSIIKYTSDGILDTTFGNNGVVTYDEYFFNVANAITLDTSGNIFVTGYTFDINEYMTIWKYNSDGSLDTSFGNNGLATYPCTTDVSTIGEGDLGRAIQIDQNGNIIVAGQILKQYFDGIDVLYDYPIMALWRYKSNGTIDITFGSNGVSTYQGLGYNDYANNLSINSSGKIIVTGQSYSETGDPRIAIWQYNIDGTLDPTFNNSGIVIYSGEGRWDFFGGTSIVTDTSDNILVTGLSRNNLHVDQMIILKYKTDGHLDNVFNNSGVITSSGSYLDARGNGITLDETGNILVTGISGSDSSHDYRNCMTIWKYKY